MSAPPEISGLIETFSNNIEFYKSDKYNEAQLRQEFIDPLFKHLGWDMDNSMGFAPQYRDVIHEASIKIGSSTKAPDYAFSIHGQYKFFLEAKKPAVNVKDDSLPAYQLRRYGWSAKLPVSILTDFEEFAIYDCRKQPKRNERASSSRIGYFRYNDYLDKWDELCETFSKDAILKGSFDKYAVDVKKHRGSDTVDDAFLEEIEKWRTALAKNIALRNKNISVRDLNYSVQKIIDRIIFLRICEDRGIEDYNSLGNLSSGKNIYTNMLEMFKLADSRYNSGLFHFTNESGRGAPDNVTLNLDIDDAVFKDIISNLYYPDSPYEFSVLPADILGQVYEQFLGKSIQLTKSHKAKIENKPEVRKAGGVFYTPTYIVNYIVEKSLNFLLYGKNNNSPVSIASAGKIKILDPACGSGSFLIVAYQYLLDWHLVQYTSNSNNSIDKKKIERNSVGKAPKIYMTSDGVWKLTTDERKRILLNNIFGVDIDAQAVEVTKLSLLLKVIEGETSQIKQRDWIRERQRILPDLENNIRCGNSLISSDYYVDKQLNLIDDEEKYRVNVFNWSNGFPEIINHGGFSCIVGNPPWGAEFSEDELEYLRASNSDIIVRMIDSFMYFVNMSLRLLAKGGTLGMILPDVFLYQKDNEKLRNYLFDTFKVHYAINSGDVFDKVTRPTSIILVQESKRKSNNFQVADLSSIHKNKKKIMFERGLSYTKANVSLVNSLPHKVIPTANISDYSVVGKILGSGHKQLSEYVDSDGIQRGVSPDLKDAFIMSLEEAKKNKLEPKYIKPVVTGGKTIKRYHREIDDAVLIYTSRTTDYSKCPNIVKHIDRYKDKIKCKEVIAEKHPVYALHRPRDESIFLKPEKLLGVITEDEIVLHLDTEYLYASDGIYLFSTDSKESLRYLMAVMNSSLFVFLYRNLAIEKGRVLAQVKPTLLSKLPIYDIFRESKYNSEMLSKVVSNVDLVIDLQMKRMDENNPVIVRNIETQIETVIDQLDNCIYEIYGLSDSEIDVVKNYLNM